MTPNNPIRVVVWGPGGLGNICIREVLRMPEFELAGVLAHSAQKQGADAAALTGAREPVGVAATTSLDEAVAVDTDVVIHLSRDFGRYDAIAAIEQFLRAGRNVVSVHPFHHRDAMALTAAPTDLEFPTLSIAAGTVGRLTHTRVPARRTLLGTVFRSTCKESDMSMTNANTREAVHAERRRNRSTDATYLLAGVGILIVLYASWTWGAWLMDGPKPITAFRDTTSPTFWVARCYELAMVITAITVLFVVIRGCLRHRRMTFDAMMVVAGFFTLFWDPMVNWMQPNFFYSSQWINVNTWTGYAPFVVNPTASQLPQPIVFIGLIYPFGWVPFAMLLNKGMSALKRRWPELSPTRLIGLTYLGALTLCLALEAPMFLMNLWGLPGAPATLALFDDNHRFAWAEYLTTAVVFTTVASILFFKNDKGQTLPERGLDGLSAP